MARDVVRKYVELNREDLDWFLTTYPHGSLASILGLLFEKFRNEHKYTPEELAELAAKDVAEELRR